jgi:hypothetical protein
MIKNCLDNNIVFHIQSYVTTHDTWDEFLNHVDVLIKMYLKDKLHTLKMKENKIITKHIHVFQTLLEQLSNDEIVLSLMRSMIFRYRNLISSLKRKPNITLQSLIIDLMQEES